MRAGQGFHHGKGLNGFSKAHLICKKASRRVAGIFQKPECAFNLIRTEAFSKGSEGVRL